MNLAFLLCALALPSPYFTFQIVPYHMDSEEERLKAWLRKNNPDATVYIDKNPQEDWLKREGFERVPINYKGKQIWIRREPKSDKTMREGA